MGAFCSRAVVLPSQNGHEHPNTYFFARRYRRIGDRFSPMSSACARRRAPTVRAGRQHRHPSHDRERRGGRVHGKPIGGSQGAGEGCRRIAGAAREGAGGEVRRFRAASGMALRAVVRAARVRADRAARRARDRVMALETWAPPCCSWFLIALLLGRNGTFRHILGSHWRRLRSPRRPPSRCAWHPSRSQHPAWPMRCRSSWAPRRP